MDQHNSNTEEFLSSGACILPTSQECTHFVCCFCTYFRITQSSLVQYVAFILKETALFLCDQRIAQDLRHQQTLHILQKVEQILQFISELEGNDASAEY
jgi:hypothetical protein